MKHAPDIVALVLAVTVFFTLILGAIIPVVSPEIVHSPERAQFWERIMLVLIGALGGYIGGKAQHVDPRDEEK